MNGFTRWDMVRCGCADDSSNMEVARDGEFVEFEALRNKIRRHMACCGYEKMHHLIADLLGISEGEAEGMAFKEEPNSITGPGITR